jgi:hypothetical protein
MPEDAPIITQGVDSTFFFRCSDPDNAETFRFDAPRKWTRKLEILSRRGMAYRGMLAAILS